MATEDPADSLISWETNNGGDAEPPADRADWVRIIRDVTPHKGVRVVLTTDGRGAWRVSIAEEFPVRLNDTRPIDQRVTVAEALRRAGKSIRD